MKKPLLLLSVILAGCGTATGPSQSDLLQNPLYAEYFFNDLAETLATIEIQKDLPANAELIADADRLQAARDAKEDAIASGNAARKLRDSASVGEFVPDKELPRGNVMLRDGMLFTGPAFDTPPGPSLHVYLSPVIDPRDGTFPDAKAIDVGRLEQTYGTFAMPLPPDIDLKTIRTVVLYDTVLQRLYGFAQLSQGKNLR